MTETGFPYFPTDDYGYLPAGTDVEDLLARGDERALTAAWQTYQHARHTRDALAKFDADPTKAEVAGYMRADLAKLEPVTARQALDANRRLVDLLTGRRWSVMQHAREAGDSWSTIGAALDMTKQGALDWYKRKIEQQEKYVPQFHDAERARAVVSE